MTPEIILGGFFLLGLIVLTFFAVVGIWAGYKVGCFIGLRIGELLGKIF